MRYEETNYYYARTKPQWQIKRIPQNHGVGYVACFLEGSSRCLEAEFKVWGAGRSAGQATNHFKAVGNLENLIIEIGNWRNERRYNGEKRPLV